MIGKKWMAIWMLLAPAVFAESVLFEDSFDGKQLESGWSAYLNSPVKVSEGSVSMSNGEILTSAHRAFITRNAGAAGLTEVKGAPVYDFFSHSLSFDVELGELTGVPKSGAPRIVYFFGVASDEKPDELNPANADSGIFFQIEKQNVDNQESYRLVCNEQVDGKSANQYLGHLSGPPSGLSVLLSPTGWQLSIKGAAFTKGPNHGLTEVSGSFSKLGESDFSQFNFTMGCVHLGPAIEAGGMKVLDLRISGDTDSEPEQLDMKPVVIQNRQKPAILDSAFPRAFFFRACEGMAANPNMAYEKWNGTFDRLQGIIGKALAEEIPDREVRNPAFFSKFKQDHPDQIVLLHFNGDSRDPLYDTEEFFPGHWVYLEAAMILSDIPAESGETDIKVSSTEHFLAGIGRFESYNADIGLFPIGKDGKHDWLNGEQVQLVSVDDENNMIRVKRGCYGTTPRAFAAGSARAAAHSEDGPWSSVGRMLWDYNFSVRCPHDPQGRNCNDVIVADLKKKFLKGGKLAAFDGVEFDVMNNFAEGDIDGDGITDNAIFDGINTWALGMLEFCSKLRDELGEDRLILGDGVAGTLQRAFGILNGMESEGWPHHPDNSVLGWSGGLNRHLFWEREAHAPVFNYINHRLTDKTQADKKKRYRPDVPISRHRLIMAASQLVGAAFCYSYAPDPEPGETFGIWDELRKGTEHELNWLGFPEGPAVHLAAEGENLLPDTSSPMVRFVDGNQVFTFDLPSPVTNELFVTASVSCDPLKGYPENYARLLKVYVSKEDYEEDWRRNAVPMSWVNGAAFDPTFYFRELAEPAESISFEFEGLDPVKLESVHAYTAPDAMFRIFDKGLVLANPSLHEVEFNLNKISPGRTYRHLKGSSMQDPDVNNGEPVDGIVTLGPLDGLFLVRTDS